MSHTLGIIVPYRNRYRQLVHFKSAVAEYFEDEDIDYKLLVIEQDDATSFNRGKLLNIGAVKAKQLGCDYLCFHDVDMLPYDVDYSFSEKPLHLAFNFLSNSKTIDMHFEKYFGGVTLFPLSIFEKINGYSNDYWGWGFEDDDLFNRLIQANIEVDTYNKPSYVSSTASLKFNGIDAYIESDNIINYNRSFSILISHKIPNLTLDHSKPVDIYPLFSVPGYEFSIYYDSFKRYNIEIFDRRGNIQSIVSEICEPQHNKLIVTWNKSKKTFACYINGKLIGKKVIEESLYSYGKYKTAYIGCSSRVEDANREISYFKGEIDTFAIFNKSLNKAEVTALTKNQSLGLTTNFGNYKSCDSLITYYDPKFIKRYKLVDLTDNSNDGKIIKAEITDTEFNNFTKVAIPFRRKCTFKLLDHKPGGYLGGRWKDQLTRWNQLRFTNEVTTGNRTYRQEGLNTLDYVVHGESNVNNVYHFTVGI